MIINCFYNFETIYQIKSWYVMEMLYYFNLGHLNRLERFMNPNFVTYDLWINIFVDLYFVFSVTE